MLVDLHRRRRFDEVPEQAPRFGRLVAVADPLTGIRKIVLADINWRGIYWEPFIFVGAVFFIINFGMSRYSMHLERRLKTDHR